jgi:hypothetical protein
MMMAVGVAGVAPRTDPPIVDLNVYNISAADMLAQIDYLADLNIHVPRFELGNEFYITRSKPCHTLSHLVTPS